MPSRPRLEFERYCATRSRFGRVNIRADGLPVRLPNDRYALACAIVACFAVFHGFAHGTEIPSLADPIAYSTGFMLATGSLHIAGIGLGTLTTFRRGATFTRGMGAAIALSGIYFLSQVVVP